MEKLGPSIPEVSKDLEPDKITRRDFLKKSALTTLGLGLLAKEVEAKESIEFTNDPDIRIFDSKTEKVDYKQEFKELTEKEKELLLEIAQFQLEFFSKLDSYSGGLEPNKIHESQKTFDSKEIQKAKIDFWQRLKKYYPNLENYSEENYNQFLIHDISREFAKNKIFVKPIYYPVIDTTNNKFDASEIMLSFYEISGVQSDSVHEWGKDIQRDIVKVKGQFKLDGQPISPMKPSYTYGQCFFQNIFVYEPAFADAMSQIHDKKDEWDRLGASSISEEEMLKFLAGSDKQDQDALAYSALKILSSLGNANERDLLQNTLAHETRHLLDLQTEKYKNQFRLNKTKEAAKYLLEQANYSAHEEINGLLGELRYADNKTISLGNLIGFAKEGIQMDFFHDKAAEWVLNTFIKVIQENPETYGINISKENKISVKNQILIQLSKFIEHPDGLNRLCEETMRVHETNYNENLSQDYFEQMGISVKSKNRIVLENICRNISMGAFAAIGVAAGIYLFKEISRRKYFGEIGSMLKKELNEQPGRKVEKIINDLQINEGKFDKTKRQKAVSQALNLLNNELRSGPNKSTEELIERLKLLMK